MMARKAPLQNEPVSSRSGLDVRTISEANKHIPYSIVEKRRRNKREAVKKYRKPVLFFWIFAIINPYAPALPWNIQRQKHRPHAHAFLDS
jgi:hypothetical protein